MQFETFSVLVSKWNRFWVNTACQIGGNGKEKVDHIKKTESGHCKSFSQCLHPIPKVSFFGRGAQNLKSGANTHHCFRRICGDSNFSGIEGTVNRQHNCDASPKVLKRWTWIYQIVLTTKKHTRLQLVLCRVTCLSWKQTAPELSLHRLLALKWEGRHGHETVNG